MVELYHEKRHCVKEIWQMMGSLKPAIYRYVGMEEKRIMKVEITKHKRSDAKALRELINDKEVLKQLSGYPYPCPLSRIERDMENAIKGWETREVFAFTILVDGEIAGSIVLESPDENKGRYDLGYYVGRKFWGRGIATEAVKQIVRFAFDELRIHKIYSDNDSDNPASGRVLEKAGFKQEGVFKEHVFKEGKYVDVIAWGIIRK